jgi:hypothetical protein
MCLMQRRCLRGGVAVASMSGTRRTGFRRAAGGVRARSKSAVGIALRRFLTPHGAIVLYIRMSYKSPRISIWEASLFVVREASRMRSRTIASYASTVAFNDPSRPAAAHVTSYPQSPRAAAISRAVWVSSSTTSTRSCAARQKLSGRWPSGGRAAYGRSDAVLPHAVGSDNPASPEGKNPFIRSMPRSSGQGWTVTRTGMVSGTGESSRASKASGPA